MDRMFYWMLMPYRRYAEFDGRSQRMEYWMFMLFYILVTLFAVILILAAVPWSEMEAAEAGQQVDAEPSPLFWVGFSVAGIFWLASLVPSIAVTVRRFHDQDKSGWLYLLNFIPYIGGLVVLVFMCLEGTRGPNQYGPDPKDPNQTAVFE